MDSGGITKDGLYKRQAYQCGICCVRVAANSVLWDNVVSK